MSSDFRVAKVIGATGTIIIILGSLISLYALVLHITIFLFHVSDPSAIRARGAIINLSTILSAIINVLGWAFIIASLYVFSRFYGEGGIFRNAIYFMIPYVIVRVIDFIFAAIFLSDITKFIFETMGYERFFSVLRVSTIVNLVFTILAGFFIYRSLSFLAGKSGEGLFRVAGILLLIGAAVSIIFIGELILFRVAGISLSIYVRESVRLVEKLISIMGIIVLAAAFYKVKLPAHTISPTQKAESPL